MSVALAVPQDGAYSWPVERQVQESITAIVREGRNSNGVRVIPAGRRFPDVSLRSGSVPAVWNVHHGHRYGLQIQGLPYEPPQATVSPATWEYG